MIRVGGAFTPNLAWRIEFNGVAREVKKVKQSPTFFLLKDTNGGERRERRTIIIFYFFLREEKDELVLLRTVMCYWGLGPPLLFLFLPLIFLLSLACSTVIISRRKI